MGQALAVDFGVHGGGFDGLKLVDTLGRDGGLLNQMLGVARAGIAGGAELGAETDEEIVGGGGEGRNGLGVKAVAETVAGGVALAGGGDGSAGFGAVEARGFALAGGSDHGLIMQERLEGMGAEWDAGVCFVVVRRSEKEVNGFLGDSQSGLAIRNGFIMI
jgi:hypothetical protein